MTGREMFLICETNGEVPYDISYDFSIKFWALRILLEVDRRFLAPFIVDYITCSFKGLSLSVKLLVNCFKTLSRDLVADDITLFSEKLELDFPSMLYFSVRNRPFDIMLLSLDVYIKRG